MSNYLHGVEVVELTNGSQPIRVVKSAVIALIGTAPQGDRNQLKVINSAKEAEHFGLQIPNYTIPEALAAIFAQGYGTVVVVNVFDPSSDITSVTAQALADRDSNGNIALPHYALPASISVLDGENADTPLAAEKWSYDELSKTLTIIDTANFPASHSLKITYNHPDFSAISDADIIGTFSGGARTGMKLFEETFTQFGFSPKLLIAPSFCTTSAIATEMIATVSQPWFNGHALIDAPEGTTVAVAITGRGAAGAINFNTSSKRAILCCPHVKAQEFATGASVNKPLSQYAAGVIARVDNTEGYHVSPSNHEIFGITGMEYPVTASITDPSSEANQLNEVGVVTLFNSFGSGIRLWGNRSAAFPTSTAPSNFIPVQRTADILHESVQLAMLQYIDKPITAAILDSVRASVNAFIRTLIGRGALIGGECVYDPTKNSASDLAAGKVTFDLNFMPPTPMERMTFESFIDTSLLSNLSE